MEGNAQPKMCLTGSESFEVLKANIGAIIFGHPGSNVSSGRFKRLGNGMWIRAHPGKSKLRYAKSDKFQETSLFYETCTKEECEMLDKMMTPYWLRRHHYPNDPYAAYHVRHDINSPRVDDKGRLLREREKIGVTIRVTGQC
ncbi:hypothetical protein ANCCEY_04314 [Ancylostoma ceylanicum]|uniref:Large ribosomal subunit protein bL35m n=1 Tax=Ancylostoma ceylanicum TaxID=53326 RepID=A0A0D6LX18_9BILA|nr:hypothetical protein ANCCEY_04314 [Ancylostoma ceylanicum]